MASASLSSSTITKCNNSRQHRLSFQVQQQQRHFTHPQFAITTTITPLQLKRPSYSSSRSIVIKAINNTNNSSPEPDYYIPQANFYKIEAIIRPWRVPHVSSALLKMGIRGVTISDVRGFGSQGGSTERQAGSEFSEDNLVAKVKMEIVVSKDQVEEVIQMILEVARTGEIGDGKIFLIPVSDVIRVRTGDRGEKAERMTGGRADMFSAGSSA